MRTAMRSAGGRPDGIRAAERGSATLWVLALASVIWFVGVAGVLAANVRAVRHQAGVAADLAALAAAGRAAQGQEVACSVARGIARANGGRLRACVVSGAVADVTVEVPLPSLFASLVDADGVMMRARAGPVGRGVLDPDPGR